MRDTTSTSSADRILRAVGALLAGFAVVVRLHNVVAFPMMRDFDAAGHALNVFDLFQGRLPDLRSWEGSHPPLYYALGALLWKVLPSTIPIHEMLRTISVVAWFATVGVIWRILKRRTCSTDAAVIASLLLGIPGFVIGSGMMTEDSLCAFFVTVALSRMLPAPGHDQPDRRHAAITGIWIGLAAATKPNSGPAMILLALIWYTTRSYDRWQQRRDNIVLVSLAPSLVAAGHYLRLLVVLSGSPMNLLTTIAGSPEKDALVAAMMTPDSPWWRLPVVLHQSIWGDPIEVFLPRITLVQTAAQISYWGGIVVVAIIVFGLIRLISRRELPSIGAPFAFAGLIAIFLVFVSFWGLETLGAKAIYFMPCGLALALSLESALRVSDPRIRSALRLFLLVMAAIGPCLTWYGWWDASTAASSTQPAIRHTSPTDGPSDVVDRYFRYRANDPIRALPLLDENLQRSHGLRISRILELTLPKRPPLTEAEQASLDLAEARFAWLNLYNNIEWLEAATRLLTISELSVETNADKATVLVRVGATGTVRPTAEPPLELWPFSDFDQQFLLHRFEGEWRITGIEQRRVSVENSIGAFVAQPTWSNLLQLRDLGAKAPPLPFPRS